MFALLRIAAIVGAIAFLSPERPGSEAQAERDGVGQADLAGLFGHAASVEGQTLLSLWGGLSAEDRKRLLELLTKAAEPDRAPPRRP